MGRVTVRSTGVSGLQTGSHFTRVAAKTKGESHAPYLDIGNYMIGPGRGSGYTLVCQVPGVDLGRFQPFHPTRQREDQCLVVDGIPRVGVPANAQ